MKDWREKAKCAGVNTEIFYPVLRDEEGEPVFDEEEEFIDDYSEDGTEEARSYCVQCPVIFECLKANLNEEHGVFGDTVPSERRALIRKAKKK